MTDSTKIKAVLKPSEASSFAGISLSTMYRMINDGTFPKPLKLTQRTTGFLITEIQQWIDERVAERDGGIANG